METIDITLPDGNVLSFSKGTSPDVIQKAVKSFRKPDVPMDMLQSYGAGVERGVTGMIGLPGAAQDLLLAGVNKLGFDAPKTGPLPNAGDVLSAYEDFRGRPTYEPQTVQGDYARSVGEFMPGLIGGPEGMATRTLTNVVAPAVVSETAGQLTKGTAIEPYARFAGGLAAHGGAKGVQSALTRKNAGLPNSTELDDMKSIAYNRMEQAGVNIKPQSYDRLATDLQNVADKLNISKIRHTKVYSWVRDLKKENAKVQQVPGQANFAQGQIGTPTYIKAPSQPKTLAQIDEMRKDIGELAKSPDASERRIAIILRNRLDDYLDGLTPTDVTNGNTAVGVNSLKEARSLNARARKSEIVEGLFEKAQDTADVNYNQASYQTAVKRRFMQLKHNKKEMRFFTPAEQDAIAKVVNGGSIEKAMKFFGRFSPQSVMPALTTVGIYNTMGPKAAALFGGAATASKWLSEHQTLKNAQAAYDLIRGGGPVYTPPSAPFGQLGVGSALTLPWREPVGQ